jgi:hypothetical protein
MIIIRSSIQKTISKIKVLNIKLSTHVVYKNDKVSINYSENNDYYSITANENLKKGTFILLEHVLISNNAHDLIVRIRKDESLLKTLYPRKVPDADTMFKAFLEEKAYRDELKDETPIDMKYFIGSYILQSKLYQNMFTFHFHNPLWILGNAISKFNHDCIPNCSIYPAINVKDNEFYGIWCIKDVEEGNELTLDYSESGSISGHNEAKIKHNFKCSCSDDYITANKERSLTNANLCVDLRQSNENSISKMVWDYLCSDIGKSVIQKRQ